MRSMLKKVPGDGFFESKRGFGAEEGRAGASWEDCQVQMLTGEDDRAGEMGQDNDDWVGRRHA